MSKFLEMTTVDFINAYNSSKFVPIRSNFYFERKIGDKIERCGCALTALAVSHGYEEEVRKLLNNGGNGSSIIDYITSKFEATEDDLVSFFEGFDTTLNCRSSSNYFNFGQEVRKAVEEKFGELL